MEGFVVDTTQNHYQIKVQNDVTKVTPQLLFFFSLGRTHPECEVEYRDI